MSDDCKKGRGQPTVMTAEVLEKLRKAFIQNMNDAEACLLAGISERALYYYQSKNKDFLQEKRLLKQSIKARAKINLFEGVKNSEKWATIFVLERMISDSDLDTQRVEYDDPEYRKDAGEDLEDQDLKEATKMYRALLLEDK